MNTAAAATQAGVTTATIRTWCRRGVIAAAKRAGRWVIDAASLAYRITIGKERKVNEPTIDPLTRDEFEAAARQIGIRATFKDARCLGEYRMYMRVGHTSYGAPGERPTDYDMLMVRRGAALAAEGAADPAPRPGPGYAAGLPGDIFGGPSAERATECHYCGLPLGPGGECDECR